MSDDMIAVESGDELFVIGASAIGEIAVERRRQLDEFSKAEDDALAPEAWIARIAKHLGRAVSHDPDTFRREMVVVGALAVAAIESFDRVSRG